MWESPTDIVLIPSDLQEERRRKESFSVLLSPSLLVGCPAFYDRPTSPPRSRNKAGNREIPNFCVSDSSGQIFSFFFAAVVGAVVVVVAVRKSLGTMT